MRLYKKAVYKGNFCDQSLMGINDSKKHNLLLFSSLISVTNRKCEQMSLRKFQLQVVVNL